MRSTYLVVAAALICVGVLLYAMLDPGRDRGDGRGEIAAEREADRDAESARSETSGRRAVPEGSVAVRIVVRPAGVAEIVLTGPRPWRGRTDEKGHAIAEGMAPGRHAVTARRGALVAARSFDVEGDTTVELALEEGIAVRGHVYGALGEGVAGAVLDATPGRQRHDGPGGWSGSGYESDVRPPVYATATSGEDGTYELRLPGAGRYEIVVRARGYAAANADLRRYDRSYEGVDFHLHAGAEISGRVLGPDDRPIAGAWVRVQSSSGRDWVSSYADTGEDGSFRIDAPAGGWSNLDVRASGFAAHHRGLLHAPASGLVIRLGANEATAEARLVIAGTAGQPAVGVEAQLTGSGSYRTATSDAHGVVRFEHVPAAAPSGSWRSLIVVGGGFVPLFRQVGNRRAKDGVMDLGEFELSPGATIRGRVTDRATGAAVEGAQVRWWSGRLRGLARVPKTGALTDREGRYELTGVPPDVVAVLALHEDYATNVDRRDLFARLRDKDALLLARGQQLLDHDIQLAPSARVFGVTLDAGDEPLPGAVIQGPWASFLTDGATGRPSVVSDAEGRFELRGYPADGTVLLNASHPDHGTVSRIEATPGTEVRIRFGATTSVRGRVVGPDGAGVAHAEVTIGAVGPRARPTPLAYAVTDEEGRFLLRAVPPAPGSLRVHHPHYELWTQMITPSGDPEGHDVGEIRLERGAGIEGRVLDEEGAPVPGVRVTARYDQPEGARPVKPEPGQRISAMVSTRDDGRFSAYGLKPGNYLVTANMPGRLSDSPVVPTGTQDVRLTVRRGVTWEGRVMVAGQPVERAFVSAARAGTQSGIASAVTSGDGAVVLEPLPAAGTFDLIVRHQDYRLLTMRGVTATTLPPVIELDPGATIEGVVVEADGTPVAGAHVQAQAIGEQPIKWAQAKDDGTFVLSGLDASKRYRVYVAWTRERHATGEGVERAPGGEPLRFELQPGRTIEGRLKVRDATKIGNVRVIAYDADGNERSTSWVFAPRDPAFKLSALAPGTYVLKIVTGWGADQTVLTEVTGVEAGATGVEIEVDG